MIRSPEYTLAGKSLETPFVNAAGSINGASAEDILRQVSLLSNTAIGAITVGSFTVPEQAGNEVAYGGTVYYFDEKTGATYNSMGLPNIGLAAAKTVMPEIIKRAHDGGKPVIASVSPTQASKKIGDTFEQTIRLVYEMQLAGADLIEVNTSCPNVVTEEGARKPILGYDLEGMTELVSRLAPWTGVQDSTVGVKLPPYLTKEERQITPGLARLFKESGVFGFLVTANTIPDQAPLDDRGEYILAVPGGSGGMSGPATRYIGREQLGMWRTLVGNSLDIMSTLGVDGGKEMAVRRELGADAVGGVTLFFESNNWGRTVTDVISDWVEAEALS